MLLMTRRIQGSQDRSPLLRSFGRIFKPKSRLRVMLNPNSVIHQPLNWLGFRSNRNAGNCKILKSHYLGIHMAAKMKFVELFSRFSCIKLLIIIPVGSLDTMTT